MNAIKPLPPSIVAWIRRKEGNNGKLPPVLELAIGFYQDGKSGRAYESADAPGFSKRVVDAADRFLRACWEQGRKDAEAAQP